MTVTQLVARERARLGVAIIARGVAVALAVIAALAGIVTLALGDARWIARPSVPLLAWLVCAICAGVALWWTRRSVNHSASDNAVASAIERESRLRAGSLRGALEVGQTGPLGRAAADRLATRLTKQGDALAPQMHKGAWQRGALAGAAAIIALVSLGAARAKAPDGWRALSHPVGAFTGSILPRLAIVDAPKFILRGERLKLTISAPERRRVSLRTRTTGAAWRTATIDVDRGNAVAELGPVDADLALVAADGRSSSDTVFVHVTDRPFVGDVAMHATFPAYLGRAPETVAAGEPARLPRGTVLTIRGRASTTLSRVSLVHEADTVSFSPDGHAFTGRFTAEHGGRYTWHADGDQGTIADVPAALELEVVADSSPTIDLVAPSRDTLVLADAHVDVRAAAADDHGLSTIALKTWRRSADGQSQPPVSQALATPHSGTWQGTLPLELAARGLQPGDEMHVVAIATDNSPWRQMGQSRELILRVPSMTEQRSNARNLADSAASRALDVAKQEKQLQQKTSDAAKSRTAQPTPAKTAQPATPKPMTYQSAEQARAMAKEQQRLQEQIKQIQQNAADLEKALKNAGALDSTLAKDLREAQELLKEAMTPQMQQQLDDVMKATQKLSPDDVKKALENLAEQQKRMKEQLEKSAEMLKRAAMEGAMQTLKDEAKDLANDERKNADAQEKGDQNAAQQAKDLSDRSKDLSDQVKKLDDRMEKDKAESGPQKLKNAQQNADSSANAMRRAAEQALKNAPENKDGKQGENGKQGTQADKGREGEQGGKQGEKGKDGKEPSSNGQMEKGGDPGQQQSKMGEEGKSGGASKSAKNAADAMEQAADQLSEARKSQIDEWKNQLANQMDKSVQETMQLARQQQELAQRARQGEAGQQLRSEQSALQQGVEKVNERMQQEAGKSTHVSPQSQSALADAQRKVQQATEQTAQSARSQEIASAMQDAAQALNRAAGTMVRDRERAQKAQSASGLQELLQQMRDAAKQQGQLNGQAASLMPMPGAGQTAQSLQAARQLSQRQRDLADKVDQVAEETGNIKPAELAREMREIAQQMQSGKLDNNVLERQQRLFKRMLDAGLSLEKDEREDQGKRESKSATGDEHFDVTNTDATGRSAAKFREPSWNDLRGLTADERRAVLEYFKRINAEKP